MNVDYEIRRNKHFAEQLSKHLGIPIHHSNIEYVKVGGESSTRFGINRKTGKLILEHNVLQPKLSIHDSIKPYLSHLKRLHQLAPDQDPQLLHYAANSLGNEDADNLTNDAYNDAMVKVSDKYRPKFTKVKGQNEPGNYHANLLSRLKEMGVKGITKLNKENFETHRKHHNIEESNLIHSPSHKGYMHEGKLYLTQKPGYVQNVGNSLLAAHNIANTHANIKKPSDIDVTKPVQNPHAHFESYIKSRYGSAAKNSPGSSAKAIVGPLVREYSEIHPDKPIPPAFLHHLETSGKVPRPKGTPAPPRP